MGIGQRLEVSGHVGAIGGADPRLREQLRQPRAEPFLEEVFALLRLPRLVPVYRSEQEALESFF